MRVFAAILPSKNLNFDEIEMLWNESVLNYFKCSLMLGHGFLVVIIYTSVYLDTSVLTSWTNICILCTEL